MGEAHGEVDSRTTPDANWDLIISSSSPMNALGGCLTGVALPVSIECFKTFILPKSSGDLEKRLSCFRSSKSNLPFGSPSSPLLDLSYNSWSDSCRDFVLSV